MTFTGNQAAQSAGMTPGDVDANETMRTMVAFLGAGPTGLTLACALAQHGIQSMIPDKAPEGANISRASVIHARTLEVPEEIGVTPRLIDNGYIDPRFSVRNRDRVLYSISFAGHPTRYPYTLNIPQYRTEEILRQRLNKLGEKVEWSCQVTDISQDLDGCQVKAIRTDG